MTVIYVIAGIYNETSLDVHKSTSFHYLCRKSSLGTLQTDPRPDAARFGAP